MTEEFIYDRVAYPSYVFPQTSPHRLATKARLRGLDPVEPRKCRYLDLGCGDGANVLLHASDFPESDFVGIDLSRVRIDEARHAASELGVDNAKFIATDLMHLDDENIGEFDYIVAHGLYSWVPSAVRSKIRSIYAECLASNGIGYISFNAYPGSHVREMLWRMMRYHVQNIEEPKEKVSEAIRLLSGIRDTTPDPLYRQTVEAALRDMSQRRIENIFHDDLADSNQAFYLFELVNDIRSSGLQYVCEIERQGVSTLRTSPPVEKFVSTLAQDSIEREQYADFVEFKRFRCALICRGGLNPNQEIRIEGLRQFRYFSDVQRAVGECGEQEAEVVKFATRTGGIFNSPNQRVANILTALNSAFPKSLAFDELLQSSAPRSESNSEFAGYLISLIDAGILKVQLFQPNFTIEVTDRPVASRFARWQAENGHTVLTSLTGLNLSPQDPGLVELIKLLDGTRERTELVKEMIGKYDVPNEDKRSFETAMRTRIEVQLHELATSAFLIA